MKIINSLSITILALLLCIVACRKESDLEPSAKQKDAFVKFFGTSGQQQGNDVHQLPDGSYIIFGTTLSSDNGSDMYLVKTDEFGNQEWTKTYGDSLEDKGIALLPVSDGYILVGNLMYKRDSTHIVMIKTSITGAEMWRKVYAMPYNQFAADIEFKTDGGYIIVGSTTAPRDGDGQNLSNPANEYDILIIMTDGEGNMLFTEARGSDKRDEGTAVVAKGDGNYMVLGHSNSFVEAGQYAGNSIIVIDVDQTANENNVLKFGTLENDYAHDILRNSEGDFVVCGASGNTNQNAYLACFPGNLLNTKWRSSLGGERADVAYSFVEMDEGELAIGGASRSFSTVGSDDAYLQFASSTGTASELITWGGEGEESIRKVRRTSDGGLIMTGTTGFQNNTMVLLMKVNNQRKIE